jgi:hypothetical protein
LRRIGKFLVASGVPTFYQQEILLLEVNQAWIASSCERKEGLKVFFIAWLAKSR